MFYIKKGIIPPKRHTVFKSQNGDIYYEEHVSREGFSSIYSNLYHLLMPTEISSVNSFEAFGLVQLEAMNFGKLVIASDISGVRVPIVA